MLASVPHDIVQPYYHMVRLTEKQRRFLDLFATTGEAKKAAIAVGYTPISAPQMAKRILESPVAQEYLATIRAKSSALTGYNVAAAMEESKQAIEFAIEHKSPMAYVRAVELRARLSGLLIERIQIATVDLKGALEQARNRIKQIPLEQNYLESSPVKSQPDQIGDGGVPVGVGAESVPAL